LSPSEVGIKKFNFKKIFPYLLSTQLGLNEKCSDFKFGIKPKIGSGQKRDFRPLTVILMIAKCSILKNLFQAGKLKEFHL